MAVSLLFLCRDVAATGPTTTSVFKKKAPGKKNPRKVPPAKGKRGSILTKSSSSSSPRSSNFLASKAGNRSRRGTVLKRGSVLSNGEFRNPFLLSQNNTKSEKKFHDPQLVTGYLRTLHESFLMSAAILCEKLGKYKGVLRFTAHSIRNDKESD